MYCSVKKTRIWKKTPKYRRKMWKLPISRKSKTDLSENERDFQILKYRKKYKISWNPAKKCKFPQHWISDEKMGHPGISSTYTPHPSVARVIYVTIASVDICGDDVPLMASTPVKINPRCTHTLTHTPTHTPSCRHKDNESSFSELCTSGDFPSLVI